MQAKTAALAKAQTDANTAAAAKTSSDDKVANDAATIQEKLRSHFKSKDLVYATPYIGRTPGVAGKYPEGAEIYFPTSNIELILSLPSWTKLGIDKNDIDKSNCGALGGKKFQIVFKTEEARKKLEAYAMTLAPGIVASAAAIAAPAPAAPTPTPAGSLFATLNGNYPVSGFKPSAQISTTFFSISSSNADATAAAKAIDALPNPLLFAKQLADAKVDSKNAAAASNATQSTATMGVAASGTPPAQTAVSSNKFGSNAN